MSPVSRGRTSDEGSESTKSWGPHQTLAVKASRRTKILQHYRDRAPLSSTVDTAEVATGLYSCLRRAVTAEGDGGRGLTPPAVGIAKPPINDRDHSSSNRDRESESK